MKYIIIALCMCAFSLFSTSSAFAQDWANLNKYAEANSKLKIPAVDEPRVVFMGNSITEYWARYDSTFYSRNGYVNRGIAGQVTSQMLLRFRADVIDLKPEVVVILAGTNDIAENKGPITIEQIAGNIFSMAELAKANGIDVVLATALPAISYKWNPSIEPAELIVELNSLIKEYCKKNKIVLIDYYSPMVDENKALKKEYGRDTVHPSVAGYKIMEPLAIKAINKALKQRARKKK